MSLWEAMKSTVPTAAEVATLSKTIAPPLPVEPPPDGHEFALCDGCMTEARRRRIYFRDPIPGKVPHVDDWGGDCEGCDECDDGAVDCLCCDPEDGPGWVYRRSDA
jgi:hypothetical protein